MFVDWRTQMGVVDLVSHGFSDEEAIIALERSGSDVTAALVLLLQRLTPEAEHGISPCEESGVEDEAVALTAIYGEAFKRESLDGFDCLCLKLPELEPNEKMYTCGTCCGTCCGPCWATSGAAKPAPGQPGAEHDSL